MTMIGCSAQINVTGLEDEDIRQALFEASLTFGTLFLIKVADINFTNIFASSSSGPVVIGIHVENSVYILGSEFNGTIRFWYGNEFRFTRDIKIHIENTNIIPGVHYTTHGVYQEGVSIESYNNYYHPYQYTLVIKNTSIRGYKEMRGFSLKVYYIYFCPLSMIILSKLYSSHAGVSILHCPTTGYRKRLRRLILEIDNSHLTNICSECGLTVSASPSSDSKLVIVNSTVSDSSKGLDLSWIEGFVMNVTFSNNTNALKVADSRVNFEGQIFFTDNKQRQEYGSFSAISLEHSDIHFKGLTTIERNIGSKHAAVVAKNSTLYFEGDVYFRENQGFYGGALSMYKHSIMNIKNVSKVIFINNHAWKSGGGIFVDTSSYRRPNSDTIATYECFYYQSGKQKCDKRKKNLYFCNNTSVQGGDSIYGGSIDNCYITRYISSTDVFNPGFLIRCIIESCDNAMDNSSLISSSPKRLCFCTASEILCNHIKLNITAVPGETIELSVIAIGQKYGVTIATVQARLMIPNEERDKVHPHISELQTRQQVHRTCTKLPYTIFSPKGLQRLIMSTTELTNDDAIYGTAEFEASPDLPLEEYITEVPLSIYISLQECSLGFVFNQANLGCQCHPYFERSNIQCTLQNQTIHRSGSLWVNATENSIIIHRHCPLGYCKTENMEVSLSSPDTQCSFDRSGTLCGQCQGNLSQVLGSLNCMECSNFRLFLVIPATLISGVVLVLFLMTLNLTVSTGTINGLIFYANIVRTNNAIFFSSQTNKITTINRVFIAWINLDIGIEMCFYNGLDAYAKTLFQLSFSLYICTIVAIIIISSHYSTLAAKLSGRNAVQVLATLLLLSYSKAIRLVITALSFTNLTIQHYPNNTNTSKPVWLYDGNVDYLQGKHIALFLIGILILVLVSLPYTTILLFSQCLQKISHYKGMSWVWKIKPLFDAYTGPYKNKHRYWTGLLLLVRVILYTIFSLNIAGDPAINLLAICIFMLLTLAYLVSIGRVYKSRSLTILECTFLINLAVLSTSTLYAIHTNRDQEVIINISVILSFIVFCGVLILHTYKRVMTLRVIKKFTDRFKKERELENDQEPQEQHREERIVTRQVVSIKDLEEPLMEREEIM